MNKEELVIGKVYINIQHGAEGKLVAFDRNGDPVLTPIKKCNLYRFNCKNVESMDPVRKVGTYSLLMVGFLNCYKLNEIKILYSN